MKKISTLALIVALGLAAPAFAQAPGEVHREKEHHRKEERKEHRKEHHKKEEHKKHREEEHHDGH